MAKQSASELVSGADVRAQLTSNAGLDLQVGVQVTSTDTEPIAVKSNVKSYYGS